MYEYYLNNFKFGIILLKNDDSFYEYNIIYQFFITLLTY
jgi:hypothetical protein